MISGVIIIDTTMRNIQPPYRAPFRLSLRSPIKSNRKPNGGNKKENKTPKTVSGFLNINLPAW